MILETKSVKKKVRTIETAKENYYNLKFCNPTLNYIVEADLRKIKFRPRKNFLRYSYVL